MLQQPQSLTFGGIGIARRRPALAWPRLAKRALDLLLAGVGGICALPACGVIALLIAADSPGPVLFRQRRLGKDGRPFEALKFRTMRGDGERRLPELLAADARLHAEYEEFHKLVDDPRITRMGRLLRKYSLDELPQLINVLRGDMSLVGPRPYLEREVPDMERHEFVILRVRPGITGAWQVSGRHAASFRSRVRVDVDYVRNWSAWLDLRILCRTVGVVIRGTGT